jgi:replication-associated recombination protein RarA
MALAHRLRAARSAGFVGRGPEFSLIDRLLSSESAPRLLWFHGPVGIGKSTLVQACADRAAAMSYTVTLVGNPEAQHAAVPPRDA